LPANVKRHAENPPPVIDFKAVRRGKRVRHQNRELATSCSGRKRRPYGRRLHIRHMSASRSESKRRGLEALIAKRVWFESSAGPSRWSRFDRKTGLALDHVSATRRLPDKSPPRPRPPIEIPAAVIALVHHSRRFPQRLKIRCRRGTQSVWNGSFAQVRSMR